METKQLTLHEQYQSLKQKHPDALLLFRIGDFYELYSEDAAKASETLGITLTKRSNASNDTFNQMAGFPHHALDSYLPKLIRAGYRVAICDELKDTKTKTTQRKITELITPTNNNSNNMETNNITINENANEVTNPTFYAVKTKTVYWWNEDLQKLMELSYDHTDIDLDKGESVHYWKMPNGEVVPFGRDTKFYASSSYFANEMPISFNDMYNTITDANNMFGGYPLISNGRQNGVYIVENGRPTFWVAAEHIKHITHTYGFNISPDDLPTDYYRSIHNLKLWNSVVVVDSYDNEHIEGGDARKLLLTPEQQEIKKQIAELMRKGKELGMMFVFDQEDCKFVAYNETHIMDWGYEPQCDEDTQRSIEMNYRQDMVICGMNYSCAETEVVLDK